MGVLAGGFLREVTVKAEAEEEAPHSEVDRERLKRGLEAVAPPVRPPTVQIPFHPTARGHETARRQT